MRRIDEIMRQIIAQNRKPETMERRLKILEGGTLIWNCEWLAKHLIAFIARGDELDVNQVAEHIRLALKAAGLTLNVKR